MLRISSYIYFQYVNRKQNDSISFAYSSFRTDRWKYSAITFTETNPPEAVVSSVQIISKVPRLGWASLHLANS